VSDDRSGGSALLRATDRRRRKAAETSIASRSLRIARPC